MGLFVEIILPTSLLQQDQLETTETKLMTPAQLVNDQLSWFHQFCFGSFQLILLQ